MMIIRAVVYLIIGDLIIAPLYSVPIDPVRSEKRQVSPSHYFLERRKITMAGGKVSLGPQG